MRIVAPVDMDAFYAAVEAQRDPALRGPPLVVGADPREGHGRGVVTAASYAARRYGIRSALPISRAWRLAEAARRRGEPETIFVRDDHTLYREVSARIMAILAGADDAFQKTGVEEAYLELSSLGSFDAAVELARRLKAEIVSQEGLTASVGIGPNKLVAKIASDVQKPDGLTVVRPEEVQPSLDPLRIRVIPLGRGGEDLFAKARGFSESAVRRSILFPALCSRRLRRRTRELRLLHAWFSNRNGIGLIATGMARQDYDLQLTRDDDRVRLEVGYAELMEGRLRDPVCRG